MTSSSDEGTWLRRVMFKIIQSSTLRAVDSVKLSVCIYEHTTSASDADT